MLFLLFWFVEDPELRLVEVGVPALGKLLGVTNRLFNCLFLRWIVIVDLFRFLLCCNESFDLVEDVLVNIHSFFLFPALSRCRIFSNGATLRLLKKLFSLHLI